MTTPLIWMQEALTLAQQALPLDVPVGAVVVSENGQMIGRGYNTRERDANPLGHAELNALLEAATALGNWRLTGCTVVVTLEPCPMCAAALAQARVARVVYAAPDVAYGACGSVTQALPPTTEVVGGLLETPAKALLDDFFRARRGASGA